METQTLHKSSRRIEREQERMKKFAGNLMHHCCLSKISRKIMNQRENVVVKWCHCFKIKPHETRQSCQFCSKEICSRQRGQNIQRIKLIKLHQKPGSRVKVAAFKVFKNISKNYFKFYKNVKISLVLHQNRNMKFSFQGRAEIA